MHDTNRVWQSFMTNLKKRDPLTFNAFGIYDSWPRKTASEARDLLKGVDSHRLNKMVQKVESVIVDQVAYLQRIPESESFHTFASNPMTIAQGMSVYSSAELIRERHGDVNLFVAASMPLHPAGIGSTLPFKQWEGLAVLTLWKLADFYDTMLQLHKLLENGQRNKPTIEARSSAFSRRGPMVVEAKRACTLAAEGRIRMQQLTVMASDANRKVFEALYEVEAVRRREVSGLVPFPRTLRGS